MKSICAVRFYGGDEVQEEELNSNHQLYPRWRRQMPNRILGPTQYWRSFWKQAYALTAADEDSTETDTLCTFVHERAKDGLRKFIVAHPEKYWWHYKNRSPEIRCSYEVIPKYSPCRLYLDLEYLTELNTFCDGPRMTKTLIDIIRAYLHEYYNIVCDETNFLILDSTSSVKFSRHVICTLKDIAFTDNSHVGRFIKTICNDIKLHMQSIKSNKILRYFNEADLDELFVETRKGTELFIDNSVYSKNRHFRLYLSTKWGKQSYLTVSTDCEHIPVNICREQELGIFLDSLISYFPDKRDLILLDFFNECDVQTNYYSQTLTKSTYEDNIQASPYPEIDDIIRSIVVPGDIRTSKYFESTKILSYEIYGNRYCENIGRCHKSNHIYWIVDLKKKNMYQKCHDIDCRNFSSVPISLPEEIIFKLDTEGDTLISNVNENITWRKY